VTTDVPGCREIVNDGENGFLVPARDAEAIADRIATLITDPSLRETMGRRGRERVEAHFTAEQVAKTIVEAYDRLLAEAPTVVGPDVAREEG
jgi:glycosyltransferase involved in cell wall biosynthesis